MRSHVRLLKTLFLEFVHEWNATGAQRGTSIPTMPGDGHKSLAYIAARRFRGDCIAYRDWLLRYKSKTNIFGSTQPIAALIKPTASSFHTVKKALMDEWLMEQGMLVPSLPVIPMFKQVVRNGWPGWAPIPMRHERKAA